MLCPCADYRACPKFIQPSSSPESEQAQNLWFAAPPLHVLYTGASAMAEKSASSSRGWIITLVVTVVVIVLIVVAKSALKEKTEVRVAKATRTDLVSFESTNGQVEAIQDYRAHVTAPGVIKKVYVQVGEHIQKGAELIRMDDA